MASQHTNPYAATWAEAERALVREIANIHSLGVDVDAARRGLHWRGGSADRFHTRAAARHDELHEHNDVLRYLLSLVRTAQAHQSTGGTR